MKLSLVHKRSLEILSSRGRRRQCDPKAALTGQLEALAKLAERFDPTLTLTCTSRRSSSSTCSECHHGRLHGDRGPRERRGVQSC